ncbi:MAG: nucleotide exchange factor GrpE [Opitutales bacterium]|nr:nucleotide exchange factor GrpE [Opitutales bacterium]
MQNEEEFLKDKPAEEGGQEHCPRCRRSQAQNEAKNDGAPRGDCRCAEGEEPHECHCKDGEEPCGRRCEEDKVEELQKALAAAQEEAKKNYDSYLRTAANLDTFRRRVQRDMEDIRKFAMQPLLEELLPAIDNLELGIMHAKKNGGAKDLVSGIEMVLSQIKKVFASFGVEEIKPLGEDFDPNFHECVSHEESAEYAENKVSKIMRTGYKLNGRLVRPASVVVSKGAKKE